MYIADDNFLICLDNLIGVDREDHTDGNYFLRFTYSAAESEKCFFNKKDKRDNMFRRIVKYLCNESFILHEPDKAEPIDKEKIGYLIEKALLAAYENGEANYVFHAYNGLGEHGEYKNATTAAKECSDAVADLYEALGTGREYLQAKGIE